MKKKFIIGGIILLVAVGFLGYLGFKSALTYYYEVDQLLAKGDAITGKNVRVGGQVEPGVESISAHNQIQFTIIDIAHHDKTIPVVFTGTVPDSFAEGGDVIVEGKLTSSGVFEADTIVTKCASKYIPAGVTTKAAP